MVLTGMTLAQVEDLEACFAALTPAGWVIPVWLIELRHAVLNQPR